MANAFLLKPLPIVAASSNRTTLGDPLNVANDYAGVVWQTNGYDANEALVLDLGSNLPVDAVMLFGVGAAPTPLMDVSAAKDGDAGFAGMIYLSAAQPVVPDGAALPVSGKATALWQAPAALGAYRYWRFRFYNFASGEPFSIARAVLGKRIQPERNFSFGANFGVRDLGSLDFSARGVLLRRRGKKLRTAALTFSSLRKDEVEATTKPLLEQLGNTEMVALLTDPAEHALRMNRAYYGPLVGDLGHTQRNAAGWEAKINLVSIF